MYRGRKIVAFTPYGREATVSLLLPYLRREHARGVLDEWMLCLNMDPHQIQDEAYARKLTETYPWIKSFQCPGPRTPNLAGQVPKHWMDGYRQPKQLNTMRFFWYMGNAPDARDTIFIRFDDDVIWLHDNCIRALVDFKLDFPQSLGVFPIIWNNAVSSSIMQRWGHQPWQWPRVAMNAVDPVGWGDPYFAEAVHNLLLHHLEHDHEDACIEPNKWVELGWRQQFSVSCFAIDGKEYADCGGVLNWDEEEHWLTMHIPTIVRRSNYVYGGAQCAHGTFYTQRDYLNSRTNLLDRYRVFADRLTDELDRGT